jgi:hypothetical protein
MSAFAQPVRWGAFFLLLLFGSHAAAGPPASPARYIPLKPDVLLGIPNPRDVVEALLAFEPLKQLPETAPVREFYDSTNFLRFKKLVAYFEKELGSPWPELLDRLAGAGAVFALQQQSPKAAVLVVIEGREPSVVQKFFKLSADIVDQELGRQEAKVKIERATYRETPTIHVGNEFHAAAAGPVILISNSKKTLHAAIGRVLSNESDTTAVSNMTQAQKSLPPNPLAWGWLNLETTRKTPQGKEVFAQPRNEPALTVAFGGWLDMARRSPFLCGGLYRDNRGFRATLQMPAGRQGMPEEITVHVPPSDEAGALPLLEPNGVVMSSSYYLDLSKFWSERAKLFNPQQVKALEEFEKKSGPFLLGHRLGKLLAQAGTHHRFIVTDSSDTYRGEAAKETKLRLGYALVLDARDKNFGKAVGSMLRAAALLAGTQVKLKLVEEKHGSTTLVGYRVPDEFVNRPENRNNPLAYITSPCFAAVGDQFVVCSTMELGRELIGLLEKEAAEKGKGAQPLSTQTRVYGRGAAGLLRAAEEQLTGQAILNQAVSPAEAREQIDKTVAWVNHLGQLRIEARYGEHDFRLEIRYRPDASAKQPAAAVTKIH